MPHRSGIMPVPLEIDVVQHGGSAAGPSSNKPQGVQFDQPPIKRGMHGWSRVIVFGVSEHLHVSVRVRWVPRRPDSIVVIARIIASCNHCKPVYLVVHVFCNPVHAVHIHAVQLDDNINPRQNGEPSGDVGAKNAVRDVCAGKAQVMRNLARVYYNVQSVTTRLNPQTASPA